MADTENRVLNMNIDRSLLARLDRYRFKRMFPSRTKAIEALLDAALSAEQSEDPAVEYRFLALARRWHDDTRLASSLSMIAMHPAYQEMIGMGEQALPLIFRELAAERENPGHWFWALRAITGADPVPAELKGMIREMAGSWLNWAREKGYR
jgi:hypothetical protein